MMPLHSLTVHLKTLFASLLLFAALVWQTAEWFAPVRAQHHAARSAKAKSKTKPPRARTQDAPQIVTADGQIIGQPWTGAPAVSETTAQIMERAQQRPLRATKTEEAEREFQQPDRTNLPQDPAALTGAQWPAASETEWQLRAAVALAPQPIGLSFTAATLADTGAYPPDSMGAVGPSQFLVTLNGRIKVFDKNSGAAGGLDANIDTFFDTVRSGAPVSDPRVRYDRLSGRWFVIIINITASRANNSVLLAVSDGAVITGNTIWRFFSFQQNQVAPAGDAGCFSDYPTLGVDAQALYIGVNQFCGSAYAGTAAFVVRKASLLGAGPIVVSAFRNLTGVPDGRGPFTPQGVDNYDPNATEGYFIGSDNNSFGALILRRVSNPGGAPVLSPNVFISVLATAAPPTVLHQGNTNGRNGQLDALDDRLFAAHLRNGRLWTAHNIGVNNVGTTEGLRTRNGSRWYEIGDLQTNAPRLLQAGTLSAETATNTGAERHYWIPSIMVSGQGHAALGCSVAGANEFVNAATAGRLATDPLGVLGAAQVFSNSTAAYNPARDTGNTDGRRRWGDYSYTSLDPCDDMTMWTIQQFCDATNSYAVRVAKLLAPPPATPAGANPPSVLAGQAAVDVTISGLAVNGSGFYDPGQGFNCRLAAQVSGGVMINSVTYLNPTTLRLNISTAGAAAGLKNVTITNPDGQTITANNLLTVGSCSYNVSAATQNFTAAGGNGAVNVTAAGGCGWTAFSNDPFITVLSGAPGSGNGAVNFAVAPTATGARTGTLTVAGQTVTITQSAGVGCNYALSAAGRQFTAAGGSGSFTIATAPECSWTAVSNAPFINIVLGGAGSGNGAVNYTVAPSTEPTARTGTITVAGQTYTVTQEAAPLEIAIDDGTFETASGIGAGGLSSRVNRLTPAAYPATLSAVTIFFPENSGLNAGDQFTVLVGANPDGDQDINGTAFQTFEAQVRTFGEFNVFPLPSTITNQTITQGDFVLGWRFTNAAGSTPYAIDQSPPARQRSYRSTDGVTFALIDGPPVNTPGNYGIRAQLLRPASGLEADVSPSPNGNGSLTASDWTLVGRLVAGLATAAVGGEFQRADCAPRATLGDGRLTAADFTQAGRYVAGLDAATTAGGPTAPSALAALSRKAAFNTKQQESKLPTATGALRSFAVTYEATGAENAVSLSLSFAPAQLEFVSVTAAQDAGAAIVFANVMQAAQGRLGLLLALPAGRALLGGQRELLILTFRAQNSAPVFLSFNDEVSEREAADVRAQRLRGGEAVKFGFRPLPPSAPTRAVVPRQRFSPPRRRLF